MTLSGKCAVITGSNSGIGLGVAREMARAGADVVLNSFTDRDEDHALAAEIAAEKMKIVSIHTVFEGHQHQTVERLRKFVAQTGFGHPVGHDRHDISDRLPNTMILYGTRGTPEMAIIDKEGRIAYQKIGMFDPEEKAALIRRLLAA